MSNYLSNAGPFTIPAQTDVPRGPKVYITDLVPRTGGDRLPSGTPRMSVCITLTVEGWEGAGPANTVPEPNSWTCGFESFDASGNPLVIAGTDTELRWPPDGSGPFTQVQGVDVVGTALPSSVRFFLESFGTVPTLTVSNVTIADLPCCAGAPPTYLSNAGPFTIPAQTGSGIGPRVYISGFMSPLNLQSGSTAMMCYTLTVDGYQGAGHAASSGPNQWLLGIEAWSSFSGGSLVGSVQENGLGWPDTDLGPFTQQGNTGMPTVGIGSFRFFLASWGTVPTLTVSNVTITSCPCSSCNEQPNVILSYLPSNQAWSEMRTVSHGMWDWTVSNSTLHGVTPGQLGAGFVNIGSGAASTINGDISGSGPWIAHDVGLFGGEQTVGTSFCYTNQTNTGRTFGPEGGHVFIGSDGLYHIYVSRQDGTSAQVDFVWHFGGPGSYFSVPNPTTTILTDTFGRQPTAAYISSAGGQVYWQGLQANPPLPTVRIGYESTDEPIFGQPVGWTDGLYKDPGAHLGEYDILSGTGGVNGAGLLLRDPSTGTILVRGVANWIGLGATFATGQDVSIPYPTSPIAMLPRSSTFPSARQDQVQGFIWHDSTTNSQWLGIVLGGIFEKAVLELPSVGDVHMTNCGIGCVVGGDINSLRPGYDPSSNSSTDHWTVFRLSADQHTIFATQVTLCDGFGLIAGTTKVWQQSDTLFFGPMDGGWIETHPSFPYGVSGVFFVVATTPDARGPIAFNYAPTGCGPGCGGAAESFVNQGSIVG